MTQQLLHRLPAEHAPRLRSLARAGDQRPSASFRHSFPASRQANGKYTIIGLPIFSAARRVNPATGETEVFDEVWLRRAVAAMHGQVASGYRPPVHVDHHRSGDAFAEREPAGFLANPRLRSSRMGGSARPTIIADIVEMPAAVFERVRDLRLPYRSVEILDPRKPEISSLALLATTVPFFKYPVTHVALDEASDAADTGAADPKASAAAEDDNARAAAQLFTTCTGDNNASSLVVFSHLRPPHMKDTQDAPPSTPSASTATPTSTPTAGAGPSAMSATLQDVDDGSESASTAEMAPNAAIAGGDAGTQKPVSGTIATPQSASGTVATRRHDSAVEAASADAAWQAPLETLAARFAHLEQAVMRAIATPDDAARASSAMEPPRDVGAALATKAPSSPTASAALREGAGAGAAGEASSVDLSSGDLRGRLRTLERDQRLSSVSAAVDARIAELKRPATDARGRPYRMQFDEASLRALAFNARDPGLLLDHVERLGLAYPVPAGALDLDAHEAGAVAAFAEGVTDGPAGRAAHDAAREYDNLPESIRAVWTRERWTDNARRAASSSSAAPPSASADMMPAT